MGINLRLLTLAVAERAKTITHATGYVGQVGAMHGLPDVDTPAEPPAKSPTDARVRPYFVLFPGVGTPGDEQDLADTYVDLDWPIQITAAGGDTYDVLALVDRIRGAFRRWSPGSLGVGDDRFQTGPLQVPDGYDPGPLLVDRGVTPHRLYTPLLFHLTAHT
ncbi:hypothetical protein [Nocardioides sp. SYSU DS0663]|uniref:hypothetical protein n=1 Tax=Nocardioides sp. SYSU DS0663 TaxID=3416445 RepID=UPI003F4BAC67